LFDIVLETRLRSWQLFPDAKARATFPQPLQARANLVRLDAGLGDELAPFFVFFE
jgi:hypothetical protein